MKAYTTPKEPLKKKLNNGRAPHGKVKRSPARVMYTDDEMNESEQMFRAIFENVEVGILVADRETKKFTMGNKLIHETLGYTPDEIRALGLQDIHPEKDLPHIMEKFDKLMRNELLVAKDIPVKKKDGSIYYADISALPIAFMNKKLYIGIFRDVSDRKRAERKLREAETRYRALFEGANDAIFIVKDFRFIECNHTALTVYGFDRKEDLIARSPWELSPKYQPDGRESKGKALEVLNAALGGTPQRFYWKHLRKDGTPFDAEVSLSRIELGNLVFVQGMVRDITDHLRAEAALKKNMALLAEAERIGHTGSWKMDLLTNELFWSTETCRIFGFSENDTITFEKFMSRVHPEDRSDLMHKLHEAEEKGTPFETEYRAVLPDGTIRHLYAKGETTLSIEGKPVVMHGFVLDITERKTLEDKLIKAQKLDSIGTLAGGLAHDYNNLLTVIMGNIDLMKMLIPTADKAYERLMKAEEAALLARDLTQQLVTFAKGGSPKGRIMNMGDLIPRAVRLALSGSRVHTEVKIAEDLPDARVDENQIRQVVQNIVINAREAMGDGGTLFVNVDTIFLGADNPLSLGQGTYIRLSFTDKGAGISVENLQKVFDPYFTTKNMGTTKGLGLGLSICYSIIKRHLGHIAIDSKVGQGTAVVIHIPAAMIQKELKK